MQKRSGQNVSSVLVAGSSIFSPVVFEGSEATNMTAHFGSTAMLGCKIRNNVEDNPVRG